MNTVVRADTLRVNSIRIRVATLTRENEIDSSRQDTLRQFILLKESGDSLIAEQPVVLFSADCNNTFRDRGTYLISGDSLILYTEFTQTGHDPIMNLRKQVFIVLNSGRVEAFSDEYFR